MKIIIHCKDAEYQHKRREGLQFKLDLSQNRIKSTILNQYVYSYTYTVHYSR